MTNLVNCLENFQIYVGTYKKYNEGSIFGEWLQLSNYSDYDELLKAMKELHKDEADPEFMIQDFECNSFFVNQNLISECFLSESIFEIAAS
jgi:antirestriction protein